jgi:hypothetical protein
LVTPRRSLALTLISTVVPAETMVPLDGERIVTSGGEVSSGVGVAVGDGELSVAPAITAPRIAPRNWAARNFARRCGNPDAVRTGSISIG